MSLTKFGLACKGCGESFLIPEGLLDAETHEAEDTCGRRGDHEADAWTLIVGEVEPGVPVILFRVYALMGNSDQTEGKGRQVEREHYLTELEAIERAQSPEAARQWGVQGTPGLYVEMIEYLDEGAGIYTKRTTIWGYHKAWTGKWRYGYVDNRDKPADSDEYRQFEMLAKKFGVDLP